jgi:regulator of sigma E protease
MNYGYLFLALILFLLFTVGSSLAIFLVVLFVLILVHEWGHYITAKKTGMRVDEFGIGFPPKLFGVKKGETEYTFNALPIGGFVRIYGENSEDDRPDDAPRAFNNRPKWAQAVVLLAGVTMNVLLAWVLFFATFLIGVPTLIEDESTAGPDAQLLVQGVLPDGPAANVLPLGSVITGATAGDQSLDTLTPSALTAFVNDNPDSVITIGYKRGGETDTVSITPVTGLSADDPARALIGIQPALIETQSLGITRAFTESISQTITATGQIVTGLTDLIVGSIQGTADYSQIAGPVGIVGLVGDAASIGIVALLTFTAFISLNLAVINLLPFPALDGGRLVFVAVEAITGKTIPADWAGRLNLVGFAFLLLLMVAVTYNDIIRLFS